METGNAVKINTPPPFRVSIDSESILHSPYFWAVVGGVTVITVYTVLKSKNVKLL